LQLALGGLSAALPGAGALGPWLAARAQSPTTIAATALRGSLQQISGAGGNIVLFGGANRGVLVDSGSPEHAAELGALVTERLGDVPLELLFNTHWHLEHTGGNDFYGATGARIVAHENTKLWMSTEYYVDWQQRTYAPRSAAALPNETFYASDPQPIGVDVGDERIEYGYLREAHTDGDIYVFFTEANVLVAGGAVAVGAYPVLDYATGGWIGGLEEATRKLLSMTDADTLIVPADGPAQTRRHLQAQLDMVVAVRGRVEDLMRKGRSAEEMLAAGVTKEFDAAWGDNRERFVANVYDGLWWQGRLDGSL
jgi:glyoxylase-like metal-dependent hydrolase (beta-lactamase superfamily II)